MLINIPKSLRLHLEEQASKGNYASVSDYLCELIRRDQWRRAEERAEPLLLEGLDSGEPLTVDDDYWEAKKRRLAERLEEAHGAE